MSKSKRRTRTATATLAITTSLWLAAPTAAEPFENWELLSSVRVTEILVNDRWGAKKEYPEALLAARQGFEIEGYYVPIEAQPYVRSFILVPDPADCPFCGTSGYGPALEVQLKGRMADIAEFSRITVRGELELITDPDTYMAYRMVDAAVTAP